MTKPQVKIWDLPVRITHWSMALLIPILWYTAENSIWGWHLRLGLVLLGLVIFRIIWGFVGSNTARFASFVKGPAGVLDYLRGGEGSGSHIGHSPLGALSVIALLAFVLFQVVLGLFSGDPYDGATGPLNDLVGVATADFLTETHEVFFNILAAMVTLHLIAIIYYRLAKKKNLVRPMVTGKGDVEEGVAENSSGSALVFVIAAGLAIGVCVWVAQGAPGLG